MVFLKFAFNLLDSFMVFISQHLDKLPIIGFLFTSLTFSSKYKKPHILISQDSFYQVNAEDTGKNFVFLNLDINNHSSLTISVNEISTFKNYFNNLISINNLSINSSIAKIPSFSNLSNGSVENHILDKIQTTPFNVSANSVTSISYIIDLKDKLYNSNRLIASMTTAS